MRFNKQQIDRRSVLKALGVSAVGTSMVVGEANAKHNSGEGCYVHRESEDVSGDWYYHAKAEQVEGPPFLLPGLWLSKTFRVSDGAFDKEHGHRMVLDFEWNETDSAFEVAVDYIVDCKENEWLAKEIDESSCREYYEMAAEYIATDDSRTSTTLDIRDGNVYNDDTFAVVHDDQMYRVTVRIYNPQSRFLEGALDQLEYSVRFYEDCS